MKSTGRDSNEEIIGTITFKQKVAQRKPSGQVIWMNVENKSPIRNRDTIRTSDYSEAIIALNDGVTVSLDEKSMIVLVSDTNGTSLDFAYGKIQAGANSSNQKFQIRSGDQTIVADGSVHLKKETPPTSNVNESKPGGPGEEPGALQIQIGSGKAELKTGDDPSLSLKEGELVLTRWGEEPLRSKVPIPKSPGTFENFFTSDRSLNIRLEWDYPNLGEKNIGQYKLIVSKFANLQSPSFAQNLSGQTNTNVKLEPGLYYWGFQSLSTPGLVSEIRKFRLERAPLPKFTSPEADTMVTLSGKTGFMVRFAWTKSKWNTYKLEIKKAEAMQDWEKSEPFLKENLNINSIQKLLPLGRFLFRVETLSPSGDTIGFSDVKTLIIREADTKNWQSFLSPIYPANVSGPNSLPKFSKSPSQKISWRPIPGIDSYRWKIQKNTGEIWEGKTNSSSFPLPPDLQDGNYEWSVVPEFANQETGENYRSEPKPFQIETTRESQQTVVADKTGTEALIPPSPIYPGSKTILDMSQKEEIQFIWQGSSKFSKYRIELSRAGKVPEPIFRDETTNLFYKFKNLTLLDEGKFLWRVSGLAENQEEIIGEWNEFEIMIQRKPAKLKFISPETYYVE
jgi:hypothetical protein